MTPTVVTVQAVLAPFAVYSTGGADITFAAATQTDGDTFACTGRELLLVHNSSTSAPHTINIVSVDDETNRAGDITAYLHAGDYAVFGVGLTTSKGWMSGAKTVRFTASNAALKVAVIRLPAGYP